jgi:putative methyltransferase (TIGR04325 family)
MRIIFSKYFYYVKKIFGLTNSYLGIYEDWNKALLKSKTYQDKETLNNIKKKALFADKNSLYFRDGKVFDEYEYHSDVNFCLLLCMLFYSKKKIRILDYGGGLGNVYNQFYKIFIASKLYKKIKFCWHIVEQKNISNYGKRLFKKKNLNFFNVDNFNLKNNQYDIIILSSALAFFPNPYKILDNLKVTNFKFLVIDREPFLYKKDDDNDNGVGGGEEVSDYLTVLKAGHGLNSSYPCWIFNFKNIKDKLGKNYNLIYKFRSLGGTIYGKFGRADYQGCLFMRNK